MSKALAIVLLVLCCIFMLPFVFGILGIIFGTVFGVVGGVFGAIAGLFGAMFSVFDHIIDFPRWGWHFGSVYISKTFLAIALVLVVVILSKKKPTKSAGTTE